MLRKYLMAGILAAGSLGVGFAASTPVDAMPLVTVHSEGVPLVKVRDGCGRGWHLNRWGRCVPYRVYRPYRHYGWYGGYWYRPHYRHWYHRHQHHRHWRHYDRRHYWRG